MAFTLQKQSSRNLVLSPGSQANYGEVVADASLTMRQRFDTSSGFMRTPSNRTDQAMAGKGTEFATDDEITAWDSSGTIKDDADAEFLGWAMAYFFGVDVATGAGPYTHNYAIAPITATMPCTGIYVEETNDVKRIFQDMAAKSFSLDVPARGACSLSLDMVGTGRVQPHVMAALPALAVVNYLLGSDVQIVITPIVQGGQAVNFIGRQNSLSIKGDRQSTPYKSSGDGLYAGSVSSGVAQFSIDATLAASSVDDVNGWFESGQRLGVTIQTNPALPYGFAFTFPSVRVKASKVSDTNSTVTWALSFDQTTAITVGNQPAFSATVKCNTPAFLIPA